MAEVFRIQTIFTGVSGSPWYSNLFFNGDPAGKGTNASDAVQAFWNTLKVAIHPSVTIQVQTPIFVYDEATGEITEVRSKSQTALAGTATGGLLPTATQGLITLRTGQYRYGRPIIGKVNVPAPTTGTITTAGIFAAANVQLLTDAASALRASNVNGALNGWVVYSRPREVAPLLTRPGQATRVLTATGNAKPSILRSRRD